MFQVPTLAWSADISISSLAVMRTNVKHFELSLPGNMLVLAEPGESRGGIITYRLWGRSRAREGATDRNGGSLLSG